MRHLLILAIALSLVTACGGGQSTESGSGSGSESASGGGGGEGGESGGEGSGESGGEGGGDQFQLSGSDTAGQAHGEQPSQITANATHAAMRLFVVHPDTGPIPGIVIKLTGPDGRAYYTNETDSQGYAEVLVPVAQRYGIEYLSLGRRSIAANVDVPAGPNQDIRLTMRYRRRESPPPPPAGAPEPAQEGIVLEDILFDTGRATLQAESHPRLDRVVEYMTHRPNSRLRVAGYTDNVGDPRRNRALSESRAQAVRAYLISHGIDESRVEAVGFGDQHPVASNDTEEGRAQNRRIEAVEL